MDNTYINIRPNIAITPFTINKEVVKKRPIIRRLRIVNNPSADLLKKLRIKDEEEERYISNKSLLSNNYQIINGEVEINGVVFPLYLVLSKRSRIFTDQVLSNSDMPVVEKTEYRKNKELDKFEEYIVESLDKLCSIDHDVLEVIKKNSNPAIIFKSNRAFDILLANQKTSHGYATNYKASGEASAVNVNIYCKDTAVIIHEFGHLFDYAMHITKNSREWKELAKKYGNGLISATFCGNPLSGYRQEDYEEKVREFFADLFKGYYVGDRTKSGLYLIELLAKEAISELELEISKASASITNDNNYNKRIREIYNYFSHIGDKELVGLLKSFMEAIDYKPIEEAEHLNTLMQYLTSKMMSGIINLYIQYIKKPTKKNRETLVLRLKEHLKMINERIKTNLNGHLDDYRIEEKPDNSLVPEKNIKYANKRITELNNLLFAPDKKYSPEFTNDLVNEINGIKNLLNSLNGLTNVEYKMILVRIRDIRNRINNYDPVIDMVRTIRKKLTIYNKGLQEFLKKEPYNDVVKRFGYFCERMIELFEHEEPFMNCDRDSYLYSAIHLFYLEIDKYIDVPYNLINFSFIENLNFYFEHVHGSVELDGYERL